MMGAFKKNLQFLLVLGIIIAINIIASYVNFQIDLTQEKRFTLSRNTVDVVKSTSDDNVFVHVLFEGDFPAGMKRLQGSVKDMLRKLRDINPGIIIKYEDPTSGTQQEIEARADSYAKDNIAPISLNYTDGKQVVRKAVFPFVILQYKNKKEIINLLEEQKAGDDDEEVLNASIGRLEYKFAYAFQRLAAPKGLNIIMTTGNGELEGGQITRLENELRKFHKVGRFSLDSLSHLDSTIQLLMVVGPKKTMSIVNQFKIDQYIMGGGKVIWLIDKFDISLDSINFYKVYVPTDIDQGLDELWFKYGIRILPDLVLDLECSKIPQVVGMTGGKPQTELFPWYYHLAVLSDSDHPIVKNIDRVNMFFPSSIDTVKVEGNVKRTVLLHSSPYSRTQLSPVRLSFEILRYPPEPAKFNDGKKPLAILEEGQFVSAFKNRITPEFESMMAQLGLQFRDKSKGEPKQIFVSNSEFVKNLLAPNNITEDIGYNKWERRYYKGNKDFILNMVEFMLDRNNLLALRSKELTLRKLDSVRTSSHRTFWQILNIGLPLLLIGIFGSMYYYIRKKKYSV
ncbi:MAG: gliding motility-associated ABC transporter substrate-binding protein GldG [Saprospiraceae bacterium]